MMGRLTAALVTAALVTAALLVVAGCFAVVTVLRLGAEGSAELVRIGDLLGCAFGWGLARENRSRAAELRTAPLPVAGVLTVLRGVAAGKGVLCGWLLSGRLFCACQVVGGTTGLLVVGREELPVLGGE